MREEWSMWFMILVGTVVFWTVFSFVQALVR
jgi:hypothetical protein